VYRVGVAGHGTPVILAAGPAYATAATAAAAAELSIDAGAGGGLGLLSPVEGLLQHSK